MIIANSSYLHISAFTIILILNFRNDNQSDIRGNMNGELDLAMMVFKPFWLTQTQRKEIGKSLCRGKSIEMLLDFPYPLCRNLLSHFPKIQKDFLYFLIVVSYPHCPPLILTNWLR